MTDQEILNRLKEVLGSLYDPNKEDMYLRVARRAEEFKPLVPFEPFFTVPPLWMKVMQMNFTGRCGLVTCSCT